MTDNTITVWEYSVRHDGKASVMTDHVKLNKPDSQKPSVTTHKMSVMTDNRITVWEYIVRHDAQYGESWRTVLKTDFFLTFMLDIRFDVMFMLNIVYAIFLTIKN